MQGRGRVSGGRGPAALTMLVLAITCLGGVVMLKALGSAEHANQEAGGSLLGKQQATVRMEGVGRKEVKPLNAVLPIARKYPVQARGSRDVMRQQRSVLGKDSRQHFEHFVGAAPAARAERAPLRHAHDIRITDRKQSQVQLEKQAVAQPAAEMPDMAYRPSQGLRSQRKFQGHTQEAAQVQALVGDGSGGARWHKCQSGDLDCPFASEEPLNHVSGQFQPAVYPGDPVRAHYQKRLHQKADSRDIYNDDVVMPMQSNLIREPETIENFEKRHPHISSVEHNEGHRGYDAEVYEDSESDANYPHLVRWDRDKWKQAALADEQDESEDEQNENEGSSNQDSPEEGTEEEEEEEETGLRPGTLTMRAGHEARGVSWADIAANASGVTADGKDAGVSILQVPANDQDHDFLEFEPTHMHMKSLDGYYKSNTLDLGGVHPFDHAEDSVADFPDTDFEASMDTSEDEGRLPGVVVDNWGALGTDSGSRAVEDNSFVAREPITSRVGRRHRVIISDQAMNEHLGTGWLLGHDAGAGVDDAWVKRENVRAATFPTQPA